MFTKLKEYVERKYQKYIDIPYNRFKDSVSQLCVWFKVIAKDRDWDQSFLYIILQFKLKRMKNYFEKYGMSNNEQSIKYINICIKLIDIILKDDFIPDYSQTRKNWICKVNIWEVERRRKQKYINLLFKIISKKSMYWWD
jgi:hypothetical protein